MKLYTYTYLGNEAPASRPSEPKTLLNIANCSDVAHLYISDAEFEAIAELNVGESFCLEHEPGHPEYGVKGEFTRVE